MSFLAPFFLLQHSALALPILFHLVRRTIRDRVPFSSLMFLQPSPPRITKRSRLEHLLLLLLRCLALALLALGFARPFLKNSAANPNASDPARRLAIVVDTSASMRRQGLWDAARSHLDAAVKDIRPNDSICLVSFARDVSTELSFEQWQANPPSQRLALLRERIQSLSPSWAGSQLGPAIIRAAEMLAEGDASEATAERQILLLSDLQEGSRTELLQSFDWPKGVQLKILPLSPPAGNAGLQWVAENSDADRSADLAVRVRVSNASDSKTDQFTVGWRRDPRLRLDLTPVSLYVPPGQSRVVALPIPTNHPNATRIVLTGDSETFDNTLHIIPPQVARTSILYLGSDSASDGTQPLYFLQRAFPQTRRQVIQVHAVAPKDPIPQNLADAAAFIVLAEPIPESQIPLLQSLLQAGRTLVALPKSQALAPSLARLANVPNFSLSEARVADYAMLSEIDFSHPLFAPLADPRFSDFTKIHFWKHRAFDLTQLPSARVLAKFDSGAPAIAEFPVGRGRIVLLASGWHPDDSQLALSTKFVPLLFSLLEYTGASAAPAPPSAVGDPILLPPSSPDPNPAAPAAPATLSLRLPDGATVAIPKNATNFTATSQPGVYSLLASTNVLHRFAVNLDPAESKTTPLPADELERLGARVVSIAPTTPIPQERKAILQRAEAEGRQKLWRWFLVATLIVLFAESILAGWTARKSYTPGAPGPQPAPTAP